MELQELIRTFRNEAGNLTIIGVIFYTIVIFAIIHIILKIVNVAINRSLARREEDESYGRIVTIMELVKKVVKYFLYVIGVLMVLEMLDINTSAIIATAGIGSLAIGMGAQTLIKDVINGFFIIFEDQYAIGDYIEAAGKNGHVEELGLRMTQIRDLNGTLHFVPNSEIRIVTNRDRGLVRAEVEIPIDGREDVGHVLEVFEEAMEPLRHDGATSEGPIVWGVTENTHDGYVITIVGKRVSGVHFDLDYAIRKAAVDAMHKHGISQPITRMKRGDLDHEKTIL